MSTMDTPTGDSGKAGTYRCYVRKRFGAESMEIIQFANAVIEDMQRQGFSLTLRQLYYKFVSKNRLPNTDESYHRLGSIISDARLAGLVSWTAIEDRVRNLRGLNTVDAPIDAVKRAREHYHRDLWSTQDWRPEVWIEKNALIGVIAGICNTLRVDFFATVGYNSQSEQWNAGQRLANYVAKGQRPIIFHLGDHDPSGLDMTRDNQERLSMFAGTQILVQRLALNMNHIEQYHLPPNPAKVSDSRAADYIRRYGRGSWELDAMDPSMIAAVIEDAVLRIRDHDKWSAALAEEASDKDTLDEVIHELG